MRYRHDLQNIEDVVDGADDLEPAPVAPRAPTSLGAALDLVRAADEGLLIPFDPKQLVTDLRNQVDELRELHDALKDAEAYYKVKAQEYAEKRRKARDNRAALRGVIAYEMLGKNPDQCIERIPGNFSYVRLQDNADESLEILREPTEFEAEMMPHLVRVIPARIEWNTDKLREVLANPETAAAFKDAAKLTRGKHVRFYDNPRPKLPAASKPQRRNPK